ncbi:hypothetical protein EDB84DRAFT_1436671 [Lactarius hengduanensis]|nr:hypothetical protein EDB84DRAFT_1436671 [Lactarius hengduanensis]
MSGLYPCVRVVGEQTVPLQVSCCATSLQVVYAYVKKTLSTVISETDVSLLVNYRACNTRVLHSEWLAHLFGVFAVINGGAGSGGTAGGVRDGLDCIADGNLHLEVLQRVGGREVQGASGCTTHAGVGRTRSARCEWRYYACWGGRTGSARRKWLCYTYWGWEDGVRKEQVAVLGWEDGECKTQVVVLHILGVGSARSKWLCLGEESEDGVQGASHIRGGRTGPGSARRKWRCYTYWGWEDGARECKAQVAVLSYTCWGWKGHWKEERL